MTIDDYTKEDNAKKTEDALNNNKSVRKKVVDWFVCFRYALCNEYNPKDGKCNNSKRDCKYAQLNNQSVICEHYHDRDKDKNNDKKTPNTPAYT